MYRGNLRNVIDRRPCRGAQRGDDGGHEEVRCHHQSTGWQAACGGRFADGGSDVANNLILAIELRFLIPLNHFLSFSLTIDDHRIIPIKVNWDLVMTFRRGSWLQSDACHKCRLYDFDEIALDCVPGQVAWDLVGHASLKGQQSNGNISQIQYRTPSKNIFGGKTILYPRC